MGNLGFCGEVGLGSFWLMRGEKRLGLNGLEIRSSKKELLKFGRPQFWHSHVSAVPFRAGQTEGLVFEHFLCIQASQVSHWIASWPGLQELEHMAQGSFMVQGPGLDSMSPESRSRTASQPPGGGWPEGRLSGGGGLKFVATGVKDRRNREEEVDRRLIGVPWRLIDYSLQVVIVFVERRRGVKKGGYV